MPSSKKTPNLFLNRWLGSDKPKKDDFNEDNDILDRVVGEALSQLEQVDLKVGDGLEAARKDWQGDIASRAGELEERMARAELGFSQRIEANGDKIDANDVKIDSHATNGNLHVTAEQKNTWNAMAPVTGSYSGSGDSSRTIALGFPPRGGMVFAVGKPPTQAAWSDQSFDVWSGMFADKGAGGGVALAATGFTVTQNQNINTNGFRYRLNESGVTYGYVVWR